MVQAAGAAVRLLPITRLEAFSDAVFATLILDCSPGGGPGALGGMDVCPPCPLPGLVR